jgi:ATP-dependent DNA helicase UvrD/PcrA
MSHVSDLRALARGHAARLRMLANGDARADAVLAVAERETGVRRVPVPAGDPLLDGGDAVYDPEPQLIWWNRDVGPELAAMYQAHEYAHFWLAHAGRSHCDTRDLDPEAPEELLPVGVHRVEGYGPKERRERDANVFARELLLPTDMLRRWFIDEGVSAPEIAQRVGVPLGVVYHQVAYAVLVGDLPRAEPRHVPADAKDRAESDVATARTALLESLDASQREAAFIERGPVLVEAGPGTGKTRTLVGRILRLLDRGVDPRSILALTFSNKAAEEMRERVAQMAPEAAPLIWMGTFHAFGLELLRKYGTRIGLNTDPAVLDPMDATFMLERELAVLALDHYQYLPEPARDLEHILVAISRAKDELAEPEDYRRAASDMRDAAKTASEIQAAEKALEVARVYAVYQALLVQEGALDFGDLIARSVSLLRDESLGVAIAVRDTYRQVLVDEYQDVNRASAVMLAALVGDANGLWVVGDARQSIYRFRGAAPTNMARFSDDFPGARVLRLARNYRSQPPIVNVVSRFAATMSVVSDVEFAPWEAERPTVGGEVQMEVAADARAEGAGIAAEVLRHRERGVQLREQAVLCRSHTNLARVGAHLEAAGIPVLYLGDLFERSEIRDLLSLLSLACDGDGRGLVRVARFPEYGIPLADVRMALRFADEQSVRFPDALARIATLADSPLTDAGRAGVTRLAEHLDDLCYGSNAWSMLSRYLFERSEYVRRLAADTSLTGRQRRLAIYQFLQFAYEQRLRRGAKAGVTCSGRPEDPKRPFLRLVRRLAMLGEDRQLRQVPEWATNIDAVRLMTVHASKGLEFPVVYAPMLGKGMFPASRRWQPCPLPPTLLGSDRDPVLEHEREEECLFFVALSRAQDVLCLSRALSYGEGGRKSNPSTLLERLDAVLPRPGGGTTPTWTAITTSGPVAESAFEAPIPETFSTRALDKYLGCPRRYLYEDVLGLRAGRDDSPYLDMHGCVSHVLLWITEEASTTPEVSISEALRQLDETWQVRGPRNHPYEPLYRSAAERLVANALEEAARRAGRQTQNRPEWRLVLTNGTVLVTPDEVDQVDEQGRPAIVVRRVKTGRPTKTESDKELYGLYHEAGKREHGDGVRVEISYLTTRTTEPVELTPRQVKGRVQRYDEAIAGIVRGEFPTSPSDYSCPRCPEYFICPMTEGGVG